MKVRDVFNGLGFLIGILLLWVLFFIYGSFIKPKAPVEPVVNSETDTMPLAVTPLLFGKGAYSPNAWAAWVESTCLTCPEGYLFGYFAGEPACFDRDGWWSDAYPKPKPDGGCDSLIVRKMIVTNDSTLLPTQEMCKPKSCSLTSAHKECKVAP